MSQTANGKATLSTKPPTHSPKEEITIRRANLLDGPEVGRIAGTTYHNAPITSWLSPRRDKYPVLYEQGCKERAVSRMLSPYNETYVACLSSGKIVGAAQFLRLGDDAGARKKIREVGVAKRVLLWVLSWLFWAYCKAWWLVHGPDKSLDMEAVKIFAEWCKVDEEKHWKSYEERANRWHAQSVVVLPEYQGKGIGKRLMGEVMRNAERDGVLVGLESSVNGEGLYRRLGFELISRFTNQTEAPEGDYKGGIMAWYPKGWKEKAGREM